MDDIRLIAIYLPQFHPIRENDMWWGKGFTEWTNVTSAKPLFENHYQPHIPSALGFCDLRLPEVREAQAKLAQKHGIHGFAYYHYWFEGKRLLERPFNEVLDSGYPEFPFCLIWANETWSRRWLGENKDILIKQTYSEEDDIIHARYLMKAFNDKRYIRINGRPVFIIYRPLDFPNIKKTIEIFKTACIKHSIPEIYFIGSNSHARDIDLREYGFDAILNYEPQLGVLDNAFNDNPCEAKANRNMSFGIKSSKLKVYDYALAKEKMIKRTFKYPFFPCSFVSWDNSPRRGENGIIIINNTPELFKHYLLKSIESLKKMDFGKEENLVFINAWNEWAEGNHLEPDIKNGTKYLEVIRDIVFMNKPE